VSKTDRPQLRAKDTGGTGGKDDGIWWEIKISKKKKCRRRKGIEYQEGRVGADVAVAEGTVKRGGLRLKHGEREKVQPRGRSTLIKAGE